MGVDVASGGTGEGADLRFGVVGRVHRVVVGGADHAGPAGAGVEFDDLVGAAWTGPDADDPLAVHREAGGELGPGSGRVDDLAGLRVQDAEQGGAPAVHDGDRPALQGREPALAELPQRAAELLLAGAQRLVVAVEVPPAGAVAGVEQRAVEAPVDLRDRLLGPAGDGPWLPERAVVPDLGEQQLRAVPRHPGMVPGEPGRLPPVGRDARPGHEPVPVVAEFTHGVPVLGGGSVQRYGGEHAPHVTGGLPGELLQHAPHFTQVQAHLRFGPAESVAHPRHGGERARLASGVVAVQALVGEVHEDHEGLTVLDRSSPGLSAVLHDPAADVPRGGQHRLLGAVRAAADQGAAAALGGPWFGPPGLVADETDVLGVSVVRGGECRVDGRRPRAVRRTLHVLPTC